MINEDYNDHEDMIFVLCSKDKTKIYRYGSVRNTVLLCVIYA